MEGPAWMGSIEWSRICRWRLAFRPAGKMPSIAHPGSMLRGGFGHALRALGCACGSDQHLDSCLYQCIFKPEADPLRPDRFQDSPPAFVVTPPVHGHDNTEGFSFWLTLLGPAVAHQDLVLASLQEAARKGFGPKMTSGRVELEAVEFLPAPSFDAIARTMVLTSPLFLKRKGQPMALAALQPQDIAITLHRRLSLVGSLYGLCIPLPPLSAWLEESQSLRLDFDLNEVNFTRYSDRQRTSMPMQGVLGTMALHGRVSPGMAGGLALGQWLHLGGKTSQGLGAYRLATADSPASAR